MGYYYSEKTDTYFKTMDSPFENKNSKFEAFIGINTDEMLAEMEPVQEAIQMQKNGRYRIITEKGIINPPIGREHRPIKKVDEDEYEGIKIALEVL